jgi:hypothetical protein
MKSPRRETFFLTPRDGVDNYLPKQSRKYILPVIGIQVYQFQELIRDPYADPAASLIVNGTQATTFFVTFKDRDGKILLQDMPIWSLGAGQAWMKPPTTAAHGQKRFGELMIDPQKSYVRAVGASKGKICIEFIYGESKR